MKKVFFLMLLIGLVLVGCEIGTEKSSDPPSVPTYEVQFDPYTPQTVNSTDLDFQGTITGTGFLSCTLCFFIDLGNSTTLSVLQHPSVGKMGPEFQGTYSREIREIDALSRQERAGSYNMAGDLGPRVYRRGSCHSRMAG